MLSLLGEQLVEGEERESRNSGPLVALGSSATHFRGWGWVSTHHFAEVASSDQVLFGPDICRMRQNTDVGMLTNALWRCRAHYWARLPSPDIPGMQRSSPGPSLGFGRTPVSSCLLMGHELSLQQVIPYVG